MKRILVTQRLLDHDAYIERREQLDIRWGGFLAKAGLLAIAASYEVEPETYFREFSLAGIILTGGNDLGSCVPSEINSLRDRYEKKLLDIALEKGVPVLGVCRGLLLIAEYFGSSTKPVKGHVAVRHELSRNSSGRYLDLLGGIKEVNSYHNYGVPQLSEELRSLSAAPDGTIEAIEHMEASILALMWHPERELPWRIEEQVLVSEFFQSE